MKKSFWILLATAVTALFAVGCAKEYDDSKLNQKIDGLDARVSKLETAVQELNNTTIPGLQALIAALQKQVTIKSVTPLNTGGYEILFSDGTKAVIKDGVNGKDGKDGNDGINGTDGTNGQDGKDGKDGADGKDGTTPVIGVQLVDGVYCWTVNGVLLTDGSGNPIPVTGKDGKDGKDGTNGTNGTDGKDGVDGKDGADAPIPQFRINEGVLEVSVDNGTTWAPVPMTGTPAPAITIEETETAWVFTLADNTSFTIPKAEPEVPFAIQIEVEPGASLLKGEKMVVPYTISGVEEGDEITIDVLNIVPDYNGFSFEIIPANEGNFDSGKIELTCKTWDNDIVYKVFVYAANGKGKTDIKCIVVTVKEVEAVFDAKLVAAGEQTIQFDFKANRDDIKVVTDVDWITLEPATKANFEWHGSVIVAANETNVYRNGHVKVVYTWDENEVFMDNEFEILQEPSTEIATSISYIKSIADKTENVKANNLTVIAAASTSILVTDGISFMPIAMKEGEAIPEVGKVYNFVGTVSLFSDFSGHSDAYWDGALVDATAEETEAEVEPVEVNFMDRYYYYGYSFTRYNTTIVYGKLEATEEGYVIKKTASEVGGRGKDYVIVDAPEALKLDELVGKNIYLYSWVMGSTWTEETPDTINVLAIDAKAFELKEATTSLVYDTDKYYTATLTPAEGFYYSANYLQVEDPDAEDAHATIDDIQAQYNGMINNMLMSINAEFSPEDFAKQYSTEKYVVDLVHGWIHDDEWNWFPVELPVGTQFDVLAWVLDENGPTGEYVLKTAEREAVPYDKYLGYWQTNAGVWKVEENVTGETYKVTGVFWDFDAELEFNYNAKTGKMMIPAQDMYAPYWYDDDFGYIVRVLDTYYNPSKNYEEHLGEEFAAMFVNKDDMLEYVAIDAYYSNLIQTSAYQLSSGRYVGNFGYAYMDASSRIDPSEGYLEWCGNWKMGDSVITIASVENSDREYTITGMHPTMDITIYGYYNMGNGNLEIYGYQNTGKDYNKSGHKYRYYLVGQPAMEGVEWYSGDLLASFVKDGEEAYSVVPGICSMDDETPYAKFGLVGCFADMWDWEGENAILFDLPNTLEPSNAAPKSAKLITKENEPAPAAKAAPQTPSKNEKVITLKEFRAKFNK